MVSYDGHSEPNGFGTRVTARSRAAAVHEVVLGERAWYPGVEGSVEVISEPPLTTTTGGGAVTTTIVTLVISCQL